MRQVKKDIDDKSDMPDTSGMSNRIHVEPQLHCAFKGMLAVHGLMLKAGFRGLMHWAVANPDEACRLIRAHLDGMDARVRGVLPVEHPGGSDPARSEVARA